MKNILSNYLIHPGTMALKPGKSLDYQTIVLETERERFVVDPALTLIKDILIHNYSCYESRKRTVKLDTGYSRKLPIPIFFKGLYMFPTHAVDNYDCCWIAEEHVREVRKGKTSRDCIIVFKNGQLLHVSASADSIRKQRRRTQELRNIINQKGVS